MPLTVHLIFPCWDSSLKKLDDIPAISRLVNYKIYINMKNVTRWSRSVSERLANYSCKNIAITAIQLHFIWKKIIVFLGEYSPRHCIHQLSCRDLGTWTRTRSKEQNKSCLKFSKDLIFNRNLSVNTQSCSIDPSEIYKTYLWCFLRDCSKIPVNNQNYVRSTTPLLHNSGKS